MKRNKSIFQKIYFLIVVYFIAFNVYCQNTDLPPKILIKYLIESGDLEINENWEIYKNAIFDRKIYDGKKNKIYVFGAMSSHAHQYLAFYDLKNIEFIKCENYDSDFESIINYLTKSKCDSITITTLQNIMDVFTFNKNLSQPIWKSSIPSPVK